MTTQTPPRHAEPRVHVRVDRWMTEAELDDHWHQHKQRINDARHQQSMVPEFEAIGIDSEGGGHD